MYLNNLASLWNILNFEYLCQQTWKEPKLIRPGLLRLSACPLYMDNAKFRVKVEIIEAKNILHVRAWFQKLAPSSKLNRTPPVMTRTIHC